LLDTIISLAVALSLGLLIGLERGWQERAAAEGSRLAGIRTFGLIGLLGGLWELLARDAGEVLMGFAFLGFALVMVISHVAEARHSKDYGVTTLVAALITFLLGALVVRGHRAIATAGAVVTTILLSLKPILHRWLQRIEANELAAALKLLLVSVVILPVLPDRGYGPWQVLNPYEIWSLVALMAAISFTAYCAIKIAGAEKGILLTGFLGGLVSSTVVSVHLARLVSKVGARVLAAGVLIACATMFVRVLFIAAIVNPNLLPPLLLPLVSVGIVAFGAATLLALHGWRQELVGPLKLRNPVELGQALQFGFLLALIVFLTKAMQLWLGERGLYLVAGISGMGDVDAITISLARLARVDVPVQVAAAGVLIATLVNTITKAALVMFLGGKKIANYLVWPLVIGLLIGAFAAAAFMR